MWLTFFLVSLISLGVSAQFRPPSWGPRPTPRTVPDPWKPPTGTAEEFRQNHGMDRETAGKQKAKVQEFKTLVAQKYGRQVDTDALDEFIGDMLPTIEQIEVMVEHFNQRRNRRFKRKIRNVPTSRWSMPILYRLDGTQTASDAASIRQAVAIWERETCIRFQEIDDVTGVGHYILFTSDSGCWSYVGRVSNPSPQIINLQTNGCTQLIGVPLHEIGHALGFYHEHTRPDRASFVNIILGNVKSGDEGNFEIATDSEDYGVPYDYSSVMHYGRRTFSQDTTSLDTVVPLDSTKLNVIGQRSELSFRDIKLANLAYCSASCSGSSLSCPGESYPDPNDCSRCKCPEGTGGTQCDSVALSDPECQLTDYPLEAGDVEECIESPNFASQALPAGTTCNWSIQAPAGCTVDYRFTQIKLACIQRQPDDVTCAKWVDIHDKDRDNARRFCCTTIPSEGVSSLSNQVVVTLKTDFFSTDTAGFRLCYKLTDPQCNDPITTAPTTTTLPTTQKATTKSAPTSTTSPPTSPTSSTTPSTPGIPTTPPSSTTTKTIPYTRPSYPQSPSTQYPSRTWRPRPWTRPRPRFPTRPRPSQTADPRPTHRPWTRPRPSRTAYPRPTHRPWTRPTGIASSVPPTADEYEECRRPGWWRHFRCIVYHFRRNIGRVG